MSTTTTELTGRKCVYERVPLTRLQRFRIWKAGVLRAITEKPPITETRIVEVLPGDPRFKDTFEMDIVVRTTSWKIDDPTP